MALYATGFAQAHIIHGQLKATYYSWTGERASIQTTVFTVSLEGNSWLLKSEYDTNWFWLVGGDGTNTYSVLVDPKAPTKAAPATIFDGDFPRAAFDTVSIPWLSFCSSHFLNNSSSRDSIPSLWLQAQTLPMSHVCSTEITQFKEPPYLPDEIKWVTSAKQITSASSNELLRIEGVSVEELDRKSVDYPSSVQIGKLLGNYQVLDTTNINGFVLPLKFELDAYGYFFPDAKKDAQRILNQLNNTNINKNKIVEDTYLVAKYEGSVINIVVDTNHVALPKTDLSLSVTDYRMSSKSDGIDHVAYVAKQWKPQIDSDLLKLLEDKKKNPPHNLLPSNPASLHVQETVRVLICIIFFAPFFVWGLRKLKNKNKEKENT
jgi:hypothetical protein